MTLLEMLEFLPQTKVSKPLADIGVTPALALQVAMNRIPYEKKRNLYNKLNVTSRAEAAAKIAYKIAMHNNLPIDFTVSLDLGTYDNMPTGTNQEVM